MKKFFFIIFTAVLSSAPLIIVPLTFDYYNPPKTVFVQLFIIGLIGLWLRNGFREGKIEILSTKFYYLLSLLLLISGISLIWAQSLYLALKDLLQLAVYIGAFFLCVNLINKDRVKTVTLCALLSGFLVAAYAIFQFFGLDFIHYTDREFADWRFRLFSSFGNSDFLANYLVLIFPIGISMYLAARKALERIAYLSILAVLLVALILTFSLGALLGLTVSLFFMVLLVFSGKTRPKLASTALLVISLGMIAALLFPPMFAKAKSSFVWRHGWKNRVILYKAATGMIKDNPIRGTGIGNFKLRYPEYRGRVIAFQDEYFESGILDRHQDDHVLNEPLQAWAETGILGFVVFCIILITILGQAILNYFRLTDEMEKMIALGLCGAVFAFLIHMLLSFSMHITPNGLLFWTCVGLIIVQVPKLKKRTVELRLPALQKRVIEIGVVLLTIMLFVWPVRIYLSDVFEKRMLDANKKGLVKNAAIEAQAALFFNPNARAIIYKANSAKYSGDYETAITSYNKALQNVNQITIHMSLADIYFVQNRLSECVNEIEQALLLNPLSPKLRAELAKAYAKLAIRDGQK